MNALIAQLQALLGSRLATQTAANFHKLFTKAARS